MYVWDGNGGCLILRRLVVGRFVLEILTDENMEVVVLLEHPEDPGLLR